ncbi:flagellar biosynthesis protein FlgA [Roseibium polysiphoniae]|uniref:Flagellar biosynthesis protein FlgA n=1 Tax=Roseibium polysiphoniae TaxID=2571221 RepID=A0A944CE12_9HYPH|nr:flagellar biosynthesis protein FlgA [Roseibium polysiphoniae]MBS8261103.1 flagellar biosynthesis protein FlgA [Roseibium polysiphoniae]
MNLSRMLGQRAEDGRPVRVGLIGGGKFGSMYLTQARLTKGIQILGIADLDPQRLRTTLKRAGWPEEQSDTSSFAAAYQSGRTYITDSADDLIAADGLDVLIDATGDPAAGIRHCLAAFQHGRHIVMVNVEADALAGPLLAKHADAAGLVYSLAWGDQPALIAEHVDWARTCGFKVVCAGKGTRYLPSYHHLTPDTVWDTLRTYLALDHPDQINLKMFNSFLDGTKSGIEMTAVCNVTGLTPQEDGLAFPPATRFELSSICKPRENGGTLSRSGTTEVTSSLYRDGTDVPHHLAMGTYVVIEAETDYARQCFTEYHMLEDDSGQFAALYRPTHMIGMELGVSVASAALRREPTGAPVGFHSDVVATTKKAMKAGEMLDGEGGFTVWGRQCPATASLAAGYLPLGLASEVALTRDVAEGQMLSWADVALDTADQAYLFRREMERTFG